MQECKAKPNPLQNVPVDVTAVINDTTGTLIASAYVNPRTRLAVIFGTGCNAAYMENIGDIPKIKNLGLDDSAQMAINCEWVCIPNCTQTIRSLRYAFKGRLRFIQA